MAVSLSLPPHPPALCRRRRQRTVGRERGTPAPPRPVRTRPPAASPPAAAARAKVTTTTNLPPTGGEAAASLTHRPLRRARARAATAPPTPAVPLSRPPVSGRGEGAQPSSPSPQRGGPASLQGRPLLRAPGGRRLRRVSPGSAFPPLSSPSRSGGEKDLLAPFLRRRGEPP